MARDVDLNVGAHVTGGSAVVELAKNLLGVGSAASHASKEVQGVGAAVALGVASYHAIEKAGEKAIAIIERMAMVHVEAVQKFAETSESLENLSAKTGMSAQSLGEWSAGLGVAGTDADGFVKAITKMERGLTEETVAAKNGLKQLGLSFDDLEQLSPEDKFKLIAERMREVEDPAHRAAIAMEIFGKSGAELLPVMLRNVEEISTRVKDLGGTLSAEQIDAGSKLAEEIAVMEGAFKGIELQWGAAIGSSAGLRDAIGQLGEAFGQAATFIRDMAPFIEGATSALGEAAVAAIQGGQDIATLLTPIELATTGFDDLKMSMAGAVVDAALFVSGIGPVLDALRSLHELAEFKRGLGIDLSKEQLPDVKVGMGMTQAAGPKMPQTSAAAQKLLNEELKTGAQATTAYTSAEAALASARANSLSGLERQVALIESNRDKTIAGLDANEKLTASERAHAESLINAAAAQEISNAKKTDAKRVTELLAASTSANIAVHDAEAQGIEATVRAIDDKSLATIAAIQRNDDLTASVKAVLIANEEDRAATEATIARREDAKRVTDMLAKSSLDLRLAYDAEIVGVAGTVKAIADRSAEAVREIATNKQLDDVTRARLISDEKERSGLAITIAMRDAARAAAERALQVDVQVATLRQRAAPGIQNEIALIRAKEQVDLQAAATALATGQITEEQFGRITAAIIRAADAEASYAKMTDVVQKLESIKTALTSLGLSAESTGGKMIASFVGMASGAVDAVKGFKALGSAVSAMEKASAILTIIAAALTVIRGLVGIFKSLFGGPTQAQKDGAELGKAFGVGFSDELVKSIGELAKKLGVTLVQAGLLSLDKVMEDTGKTAHDMFDQIETLMNTSFAGNAAAAAEQTKQLGEAFTKLGDEAAAGGRVGDAAMVKMIQDARSLGIHLKEIDAAVSAALGKAVAAQASLFGQIEETTHKAVKKVRDVKIDPTTGKKVFGPEHFEQVDVKGSSVKGGIPILTPEDARAQATIFSAVFWSKVKEDGLIEAAKSMQGPFEALKASLSSFGDDAAKAILAPISDVMALMSNEKLAPLADGIKGLQDTLTGLADSGYLTADSFSAIQEQAVSTFNQMIAGGASSQTALMAIAPLLGQLRSASANFGIQLDANTQALIDQASTAGVAFSTDPMNQMVDILKLIAVQLGATLPAAMAKTGTAVQANIGIKANAAVTSLGNNVQLTSAQMAANVGTAADIANERWTQTLGDFVTETEATAPLMQTAFDHLQDSSLPSLMAIQGAIRGINGQLSAIPANAATAGDALGGINGPGSGGSGGDPGERRGRPPVQAAHGAIFRPRQGGTHAIVGEGGATELAAPVKGLAREIGVGLADGLRASAPAAGGGGVSVIDSKQLMAFIEAALQRGDIRVPQTAVKPRRIR